MKRKFFITQYAAITRKKRLMLLRNDDCSDIRGKWVFPGGHIDMELDPLKALEREIKEELNMTLKSAVPIKTEIKLYPTGYRFVVYYKVSVAGKIKISKEHDSYRWVSLEDLKKLKLRDAQEKKVIENILRNVDTKNLG
ncbi:NUDIX hydrolase [archaeon]|nr:NUDIX hydrolase [archaeon]